MSWDSETEGLLTAASPDNAERLSNEGRGPLTSNIAEAGGFFRTRTGLEAPDIQFHALPTNALVEDGLLHRDDATASRSDPVCSSQRAAASYPCAPRTPARSLAPYTITSQRRKTGGA